MGRSFPSSLFGTRLINSSSWEDSRAALPRYQEPAWLAGRVSCDFVMSAVRAWYEKNLYATLREDQC